MEEKEVRDEVRNEWSQYGLRTVTNSPKRETVKKVITRHAKMAASWGVEVSR
jgi:hypothetical protein